MGGLEISGKSKAGKSADRRVFLKATGLKATGSVLALMFAGAGTASLAEPLYEMQDLGTLGGKSYANAISADGTFVVGGSQAGNGEDHAFLWVEDATSGAEGKPEIYDLSTLGGVTSEALDVNADGSVVVGSSRMDDNSLRAFRWVEGETGGVAGNPEMYDLGTLGDNKSEAFAVNADGSVVVGRSGISAFRWVEGATGGVAGNPQMYDLGNLGGTGSTYANDVNADGTVVVGQSGTSAFRWVEAATDGVAGNPQMQDLGHLFEAYSYSVLDIEQTVRSQAAAVNADGSVVVGSSRRHYMLEDWWFENFEDEVVTHAFRWVEGGTDGVEINPQMQDLGTLGGFHRSIVSGDEYRDYYFDEESKATDVSADGTVVVGWSDSKSGRKHAFRWVEGSTDGIESNPQMQDLGTLTGAESSFARGVSADGSVVVGESGDRAFIWGGEAMLDYENTVTEVLGSAAQQIGALDTRNSVVSATLGKEVDFRGLVASDGTLSSKGAPGAASFPFGLRLEAGLSADGADDATFAGFVFGAAVAPNLSVGAHYSRGGGGDTDDGFRFDGPYNTFGGYVRGGDRYDGFTWKLALAKSDGTARISRPGEILDTEAGNGVAGVGTLSARIEASYALPISTRTIVAPKLRLNYSATTREAYTEDTDISFPVSYDAARTKLTTATFGADVYHAANERLTLRANAGVEADLTRDASAISGTSAIPGMTSFSLDPIEPDFPVRVYAGAGATYDVGANNAITFDAGVSQNAFTGDFTASGSVGYEVRF